MTQLNNFQTRLTCKTAKRKRKVAWDLIVGDNTNHRPKDIVPSSFTL